MSKFGFGMVGCGMISQFHAKAIEEIPNAELVGCFDHVPEAAQSFADKNHCRPFATVEEMASDDAVSVVTICTPSGAHMEPTLIAAAAGKHVVVEKPLEVTLDRCDQMIQACRQSQVTLSTVFQSRYHDSSRLLKQAIDDGRFGQVALGDAYVKWFRTQEYYDSGAWRGTWKLDGGGALMNQAIHNVDLLCWLMGPVKSVSAMSTTLSHERIEVEDTVVANLSFVNGALGVIEATTSAYPGSTKKIEISGSMGSAAIEEDDISVWDFADAAPVDEMVRHMMDNLSNDSGGAADPAAIGHHGHKAHFEDVLAAIESGRQPLIDGEQGRVSVELVLAIYQACQSGQRVDLPLQV